MNAPSAVLRFGSTAMTLLATATALPAGAQEFALALSPPRIEAVTQPGKTLRTVVDLENAGAAPLPLLFSTAEWDLSASGGVSFTSELRQGSCRPWAAIERHQAVIPGKGRMRFRLEVSPPADAAPTECRFALLITGSEAQVTRTGGAAIAMAGQVALIVYVAVGDVRPLLTVRKTGVETIDGVPTPVVFVENSGTAHGRLEGLLSGTDAAGKKWEFAVSTLPVLPGETRRLMLSPQQDELATNAPPTTAPRTPVFPLSLAGSLSDGEKTFRLEGRFEP